MLRFVVTGFGKFESVNSNPTEWLVENLPEYLRDRGNDNCPVICAVLRVAVSDVDEWLAATAEKVKALYPEDIVVWLHLGVHAQRSFLALEQQAINCANFERDENGCKMKNERIEASNKLPITACLRTDIDVDGLLGGLLKCGFQVELSEDAGRMLCNWIYFRSLRLAKEVDHNKWHSLFVHVPLFTHISKQDQLKFLEITMDSISEQLVAV